MNCEICTQNKFKYKCPKCGLKYCSLACYKSESHKHTDLEKSNNTEKKEEKVEKDSEPHPNPVRETTSPELTKLSQDPKFLEYLKEPIIQVNLHILFEIMQNVSLTNEYNRDGRLEIANKKLVNLRSGGLEENEYFDEFCEYILDKLYNDDKANSKN
ncbi:unnamed protein product [Ambrosiozyma monospora]|uniref:Unnamed protein product n=1 Tax=Ambrosiozyma monospora TaxID=43982 RepID=A0A9W6Z268_AMBMO|nr:unnamed protein product [Ambrosiozyma monospora]